MPDRIVHQSELMLRIMQRILGDSADLALFEYLLGLPIEDYQSHRCLSLIGALEFRNVELWRALALKACVGTDDIYPAALDFEPEWEPVDDEDADVLPRDVWVGRALAAWDYFHRPGIVERFGEGDGLDSLVDWVGDTILKMPPGEISEESVREALAEEARRLELPRTSPDQREGFEPEGTTEAWRAVIEALAPASSDAPRVPPESSR